MCPVSGPDLDLRASAPDRQEKLWIEPDGPTSRRFAICEKAPEIARRVLVAGRAYVLLQRRELRGTDRNRA